MFKRAPTPDDPNRCQAIRTSGGQCEYLADPDSRYCTRHGGWKGTESKAKDDHQLYLTARWADKIGRNANHPKQKSLREEMAILRVTQNEILEMCDPNDPTSLLVRTPQLIELSREIGKLARTAHQIEKEMNVLLDKNQALEWVQELLEIFSNYVSDPEQLKMLSEDMIASLEVRTRGS